MTEAYSSASTAAEQGNFRGEPQREEVVAGVALPLRKAVLARAAQFPGKTALIAGDRSVTYRQLQDEIEQVRSLLYREGVGPGDRVAAIMPSCVEFAALLFASMQIAANLVPLDMMLTDYEIQARLDTMKPKLVFVVDPAHKEVVGRAGYKAYLGDGCSGSGSETAGDANAQGAPAAPAGEYLAPQPQPAGQGGEYPVLTIFTSGSTGHPKGVLLTEANLTHAVVSINEALAATSDDIFLTSLPVSHIYGINSGILLPLSLGATSVLMPKFKATDTLDLIERHHATVLNGVPSMYERLVNRQRERVCDLSSMRTGTIAGAKCSHLDEFQEVLGCKLRILYGSTESPIVATTRGDDGLDTDVTGVGRFIESITPRIVDENGSPVPAGETGEIICLSPGTMAGYYNDAAATLMCVDEEGWMHTGDLAYEDAEGYVHVVGRKTDVINRGGYKVTPAEVERIYEDMPAVASSCAMGFPHKELGQQIIIFVVLSDSSVTADELRTFAKGRISKYKVPDQVIILDEMPYLANGKIDKQALIGLYDTNKEAFHDDTELQQKMHER